jgi:hypothetical protein
MSTYNEVKAFLSGMISGMHQSLFGQLHCNRASRSYQLGQSNGAIDQTK